MNSCPFTNQVPLQLHVLRDGEDMGVMSRSITNLVLAQLAGLEMGKMATVFLHRLEVLAQLAEKAR